ncbi:MAG: SLBB domain-containing protein [Candidatus Aquirickettsiella gammari]
MSILKQGEASGLTIEQAQAMAAKRGLPTTEVQKLKDRVAKIQGGGMKGAEGAENAEAVVANKVVEKAAEATTITGKIQDAGGAAKGTGNTIYGQEYFRNGDIKIFDKSTDAKAPANYVIGIGDELGVSVFGYSYYNEVLKVDARGAINPNNMGPIFIKGLAFDKAKSVIRAKMGQYFDLGNNKVEIALVYARNITVNIVGEVLKPGSYNFPAINSAFNALIVAGGPSNIGTLRNIQIKRNGKLVKSLDVYAFLNDANAGQDFFLEENDYIIVGSAQKVVKLSGAIQRPANFELLPNENLADVIQYAGGFTANAYASALQVRRIENKEIKLLDINFDSLQKINKDFTLKNGDEILVRSSVNEVLNKVAVQGAINFPGEYHFNKASTVQSLINIAGGLKNTSQSDWAYVIRTQSDLSKAPLHSGHYGNFIANPAFSMARLLASMKDEHGRVLIPGYYATTKFSKDDLRALDAVADDEVAIKKRVGVAATEKVASNYQRALQYPSLNIRGMAAASVDNSAANIIPKEAIAEIDIRTTQEADAQYLTDLLKKHIVRQGYHVIDHAPDDAERLRYPKLLQMQTGLPAAAARQAIASPVRQWVESAHRSAYADLSAGTPQVNYQPMLIRASGATVPTHEIVGPLGLPFVIVPTVNVDNNQHTYDENLRMGNYLSGMRIMLGLLNTAYP